MAKIALLVAIVLVGGRPASTAPLPPLANLLPNSSFEQPQAVAEDLAAGWARYQCGYTRSRERSYAPDIAGPWSCRLTGAGGTDEKGLGGTNTGVSEGFPDHGTCAATNSIYIASCTQGNIYGAHVTAGYTDGTEQTFSFVLSDAQIKDNLGCWKTYRLTFTTNPQKKLKSFTYWCLVWTKGEQKFVGTVYFDEVELRQVETGGPAEAALPFALASRTQTPPRLDGVMDDACWQRSLELSPFVLSGGTEAATEQTKAPDRSFFVPAIRHRCPLPLSFDNTKPPTLPLSLKGGGKADGKETSAASRVGAALACVEAIRQRRQG
jgi:hypothetical protein